MNLGNIIAKRHNKTIYRDGNVAIKVFDEEYSTANILNEALNQARVAETGLSIPGLLEVSKINGKWAILTDFIEGKTLENLMREFPEKHNEHMELFVNIQNEILSKRAPLLNKLKDKIQRKISETDLDATTRYELYTRLESMPKHNKVCHGDFNPGNIIISPDGTSYIIDWSHVTQGNAAADAAETYLLFHLSGDAETAEEYIKLYCAKTDTAKQYIQKWIPVVAAARLSKGKLKEHEFLMNWIDVVEYE